LSGRVREEKKAMPVSLIKTCLFLRSLVSPLTVLTKICWLHGNGSPPPPNCKIWGFHGGEYEEGCLLGCYAVWLL
jgi:hypothetical protein